MLSMKTRYALMALSKLAKEYGKGAILIGDIASEENIPRRFLENILQELKRIGIVGSRMGKSGGYFLVKAPGELTLLEIVQYMEGSIGLLYCVSEKQYQSCEFCKKEEDCKIREAFVKIRDYSTEILGDTTFADVTNNCTR
ncbi:MAG: Rrf2 family transcriptional regulator [Bacteroidales bacterium]|nr:Rrf2 family transcriptional regulator [Bacteroidales bacterium]